MKAMNHARVNFIAIDPEWTGEVVQFINGEARPRALRQPAGGGRPSRFRRRVEQRDYGPQGIPSRLQVGLALGLASSD